MKRTVVVLLGIVVLALAVGAAAHAGCYSDAAAAAPPASPWTVAWRTQSAGPWGRLVAVRWAADGSLTALAAAAAVYRGVSVAAPLELPDPWLQVGQPGLAAMASRLASDGAWWVTAGSTMELAWVDGARRKYGRKLLGAINDIDVAQGRLALAGCTADEGNRWALDGGVIFLGRLDEDLADLRPLLTLPERGDEAASVRCGMMSLGRVRFLPDGGLAAYPGVVAGMYLYDAQGRLARVVDTAPLGLDATCDLRGEAYRAALVDPDFHFAWRNRRVLVDDLVVLDRRPALILRRRAGGITGWQLARLRPDGSFEREALPLESASPFATLHADARGGKLLVALCDAVMPAARVAGAFELVLLERRR